MKNQNLKVLVPVDLRESAFNALRYAGKMPEVSSIIVLYVMEEGFANRGLAMHPTHIANVKKELTSQVRELEIEGKNLEIEVEYEILGSIASISRYVEERSIDLIVMPNANKKIFFKAIFGNTTLGVIKGGFSNVLVIPDGCNYKAIDKVLIALDSEHASRINSDLIDSFGEAKISIVYVGPQDDPDWEISQHEISKQLFDDYSPSQSIEIRKIVGEEVATSLIELAEKEHSDVIVFFIKEQSIINRLFFSSTTRKVLRSKKIPLFFIK